MHSVWGQKSEDPASHQTELRVHKKIYKLLFCKEEGGNMKGFKKGIALIAVLAFLITAILPVSGLAADTTALTDAIAAATETMNAPTVSADGSDVLSTDKWVTEAAKTALQTAITAAQAVADNDSATAEQIAQAVTDLNDAVTTFEGEVKDGLKAPEKSDLTAAITAATEKMNAPTVSADGSDVPTTDKWVTEAAKTALQTAITAAQAVADNDSATAEQIAQALSDLNDAVTTFEGEVKDGLQAAQSTIVAKDGVNAAAPGSSVTLTAQINGRDAADGAGTWSVDTGEIPEVDETKGTITYQIPADTSADEITFTYTPNSGESVTYVIKVTKPENIEAVEPGPVTGDQVSGEAVEVTPAPTNPKLDGTAAVDSSDFDGDSTPVIAVDNMAGMSYEWTVGVETTGGEQEPQLASASNEAAMALTPNVGVYTYAVTITDENSGEVVKTLTYEVTVKGDITTSAPGEFVEGTYQVLPDSITVTSTWTGNLKPVELGGAPSAVYLWSLSTSGSSRAAADIHLEAVNGDKLWSNDANTEMVTTSNQVNVVGMDVDDTATVTCQPVAPIAGSDYSNSAERKPLADPENVQLKAVTPSFTIGDGEIWGYVGSTVLEVNEISLNWGLVGAPNGSYALELSSENTSAPALNAGFAVSNNPSRIVVTPAGALPNQPNASYVYTLRVTVTDADGNEATYTGSPITLYVRPYTFSTQGGYWVAPGIEYPGVVSPDADGNIPVSAVVDQTEMPEFFVSSTLVAGAPDSGWNVQWQVQGEDGTWSPALGQASVNPDGTLSFRPAVSYAVTANEGSKFIFRAVLSNGNVVSADGDQQFALSIVPEGSQVMMAFESADSLNTGYTTQNSTNAVPVRVIWNPNKEPKNVTGYNWNLTAAPENNASASMQVATAPGYGAITSGAGTKTQGSSWTTAKSGTTVNASRFTNIGRYTVNVSAQVTGSRSSGSSTTIYIIVGNLGVSSNLATQKDSFSYWIQPADGYFKDTADAPKFDAADLPTGSLSWYNGSTFVMSENNLPNGTNVVWGATPGAGAGSTVGSAEIAVNSRFQLYFNPAGITYNAGTPDAFPLSMSHQNVTLPSGRTVDTYWGNWVALEWRYKPSQYAEEDGDGLDIPVSPAMGFSGVNSPLLTSGPLTAGMDGWWFGLEIHDKANENAYTATRWVLLDISGISPATQPAAQITSYPNAQGSYVNLTEGSDVTFTAAVQASIPETYLTYQWQSKVPVTAANPTPQWQPIAGADAASYTISDLTQQLSGTSYRCVVTNTAYANGVLVPSNELTLNVTAPNGAVVISNPQSPILKNLYAGRTLTTSVTARTDNGDAVTYQWYVKSFPGQAPVGSNIVDTWEKAAALLATSGSHAVPGATSASLTTEPLTEGVYEFTCRVQNQSNAARVETSAPVYVVVTQRSRVPFITTPSNITSVGVVNGYAKDLKCEAWVASGEPLRYQWQTSADNGTTWNDLTCTDSTLTITDTTTIYTGSLFHCVVHNDAAEASTVSPNYVMNVWNVANMPAVTNAPTNLSLNWNTNAAYNGLQAVSTPYFSGAGIQLTSTARPAQGAEHSGMAVRWNVPAALGSVIPANAALYPAGYYGVRAVDGSYYDPATGAYITITRNDSTTTTTYTSTLTIPVPTGDIQKARELIGSYSCVWFNNQNSSSETSGAGEISWQDPAATSRLIAPQTESGAAQVAIAISGNPQIVAQTATPQTVVVGQTATFSVTALLNQDANEIPKGSLVYVWQMTSDGGATWRNCLSTDGTGQFTDTFTTAPVTEDMYDNSTASNVAGPTAAMSADYGTIGNAKTVYMYRCIVANRTTGAKATGNWVQLIITQDAAEPPVTEEPTLESAGNITIEGTSPNRYATGITISAAGTTVDEFLEGYGWQAPAGYTLQIVGSNGTKLDGNDRVYTGCVLQLVKDETGEVVDSATIIVRGDVLGANNTGTVGTLAINQLVRMAQDLNETRPLDGIYEMAGDFNGNGSVDIADLVAEAQLLSLHEPVQK